jgi:predicted HAD superfamily Cof-like phosphohydrolase
MNTQLKMVYEFHQKFRVGCAEKPTLIDATRSDLRYRMMREEVEEYRDGVENGDIANLVKELCDVIYTTYGTVIEHGLQDIFDEAFAEVHRSNMTKEYSPLKVQKGLNYVPPNMEQFFEEGRARH